MKWKYKILCYQLRGHSFIRIYPKSDDPVAISPFGLEKVLNVLGEEGWELVQFSESGEFITYHFKKCEETQRLLSILDNDMKKLESILKGESDLQDGRVSSYVRCEFCDGTGRTQIAGGAYKDCLKCNGHGRRSTVF